MKEIQQVTYYSIVSRIKCQFRNIKQTPGEMNEDRMKKK